MNADVDEYCNADENGCTGRIDEYGERTLPCTDCQEREDAAHAEALRTYQWRIRTYDEEEQYKQDMRDAGRGHLVRG
jgi:hypothetical protein